MAGNAVLAHPLKQAAPAEAKERPHSFSGGLPSADLRRLQQVGDSDHDRLQQQQWAQNHNAEQLTYPSLTNQVHRPVPQQQFTYPPNAQGHPSSDLDREDGRLDYNAVQQQRTFAAVPPHINHGLVMNAGAPSPPQSAWHKPTISIPAMNYRQAPRSFAPQGLNPSLGYPGGHTSHLSLGNTQQLYEMMLPGPPPHDNHHPAVARVQQQHNVFRATHHHSASDPSTIRDAATLALLNNNMQSFNPNMFQPNMPPPAMSLYANQYYGAQELAVQQVMAARLQAQYTGSYNVAATPAPPVESDIASPTSSSGQTGPSANNRKLGLYKTELCRSWEEKGSCRYGGKCQFAHGEDELRKVSRHPKASSLFLFTRTNV
jgi:tristetraprolin